MNFKPQAKKMKVLVACEYSGRVRDVLYKGWDLVVAHPPCTFLSVAGNRWFNVERYGQKAITRLKDREQAIAFSNSLRIWSVKWWLLKTLLDA